MIQQGREQPHYENCYRSFYQCQHVLSQSIFSFPGNTCSFSYFWKGNFIGSGVSCADDVLYNTLGRCVVFSTGHTDDDWILCKLQANPGEMIAVNKQLYEAILLCFSCRYSHRMYIHTNSESETMTLYFYLGFLIRERT